MKKYTTLIAAITLILVSASSAFAHWQLPDDQTHEKVVTEPSIEDLEAADYIDSLDFRDPAFEEVLPEEKSLRGRADYSNLDPQNLVPQNLLNEALAYYKNNLSKIRNKNYLSVVDFSANASKARFFIINMSNGSVLALHVAHGSGSDKNNDGYAETFSNKSGSNASSLGYYLTAETYIGKHGQSLRLDGLSSTNSNARSRAVVIHGASYVQDSNVKAGRSWGCLAVSNASRSKVVSKLEGGALIYAGLSK